MAHTTNFLHFIHIWNIFFSWFEPSFYEPQITIHYKKYTPATQAKTCFWLVSLKVQELHSRSTWKANACKSPFENFCSRNVGSFYLVVRVFMWQMYTQLFASSYIWPATDVLYVVGWIISFRQIAVLDSQNVLTFFILIEVFENYFLAFWYFHQ